MIYYLHGPDDFTMREQAAALLKKALPAETADLNLTRLASSEVTPDALLFACEAAPFLADRRAVVVDQFFSTSGAKRGRAKAAEPSGSDTTTAKVADVAAYLPRVPAETVLIFLEANPPPKTGAAGKAFAAAQVKEHFFPTLAGQTLARWIKERARAYGGEFGDQAAHLLATFVGGDLRLLANEVQKLVTYAGPGRPVEPEHVQLLVNQAGEVNIFALVDAVGQGQRPAALKALHTLLEAGERPERILGMVARQVRLLLQARDGQERHLAPDALASALGVSGYPLRKVQEQARLFTVPRLMAMHRRMLEADLSVKTGQQVPSLALELLVADLTGASNGAATTPSSSGARRPPPPPRRYAGASSSGSSGARRYSGG